MRSKASFRSHPIHPALIPFPIAFLVGAFVFDVAGVILNDPELWSVGGRLAWAGVITGLLAAVPGFIDYLYTVPPNSTGKTRATKHMAVNLAAIVLFAIASQQRPSVSSEPSVLLLIVQAVALGLLTAGGWMGGVLVGRNQISVDHRYAGAGKWNEERIAGASGEVVIAARKDELQVDQMKLLHVGRSRIVLGRTESGWVAFDDRCTHRGASLADGVMICGTVQCPWHGSQFDTRSGEVRAGPAKEPVATYRLEERGDGIYLVLP
jgi:nitrite reductase/ring-hydroxylating ferredoxin subunit/uncharacterized membrane protein